MDGILARAVTSGHSNMDKLPKDIEELPLEISQQIMRERSIRHGSLSALHRWWARRPAILARMATYMSLVEGQSPNQEFLTQLCDQTPSAFVINQAQLHIREAQWRAALRELQHALDEGKERQLNLQPPDAPRVLDPFAGGGSIPYEAARLGCQAFAGDLNPVAYHVMRASLQYPAAFAQPDAGISGSSPAGSWRGLIDELQYWVSRVRSLVSTRVSQMFPADPNGRVTRHLIWFHLTKCSNPACGALFAPGQPLELMTGDKNNPLVVAFEEKNGRLIPYLTNVAAPHAIQGRIIQCPNCGSVYIPGATFAHKIDEPPLLAVMVTGEGKKLEFNLVTEEKQSQIATWNDEDYQRLNSLLGQANKANLSIDLPDEIYHTGEVGRIRRCRSFRDLFSVRQQLIGLEYAKAIEDALGEMKMRGMSAERVQALATYLAFFLGYLADYNSMLCRWQPSRFGPESSLGRTDTVLPWHYVESHPDNVLTNWVATVLPSIQECATNPPASEVRTYDAGQLPYANDYFDAIVTDPPYFDSVPYSDLADFYWVWESGVLDATPSLAVDAANKSEEVVYSDRIDPEKRLKAYQQGLRQAFQEALRVLKPGRMFCMLLTTLTRDGFDEYVEVAQQVGFELVNVRAIRETHEAIQSKPASNTFLVYFRKAFLRPVLQRPTADASLVLSAADANRPVLYAGLAELLAKELTEQDIAEFAPAGAKGSQFELLMEALVYHNPRELMEKCFGRSGLRRLSQQLDLAQVLERGQDPLEAILSHFGFSLPSPAKWDGVAQAIEKVRFNQSRLSNAREKMDLRGPFLDSCTAVEKLVRITVWGWAQVVFGRDCDQVLIQTLTTADPSKSYDINRLSFGHVLTLFRDLPDAVAASAKSKVVEQKFGRSHIYLPVSKKTKFADRLGELVTLRNKVEHDKDGYLTNSTFEHLLADLSDSLKKTRQLLTELGEDKVIPRIATPVQEIRDQWNRVTYKIILDDQTEVEATFSGMIRLGAGYLYFGGGANPRPVDPWLLPFDEFVGIL
jgi:hypothetical protein